MGGVLPTHPQRVLGVGGTAGMVHPATGFMVSRMLGVAPTIADAIIDQLARPADSAATAGACGGGFADAEGGGLHWHGTCGLTSLDAHWRPRARP
jgi:hypothetical protein